ncbi:MAG: hypothetical protein ACRDOO_25320 [Actinomadura sp.]
MRPLARAWSSRSVRCASAASASTRATRASIMATTSPGEAAVTVCVPGMMSSRRLDDLMLDYLFLEASFSRCTPDLPRSR